MRILLKVHDKNNDTVTYTEIMYAFNNINEIPQSIELCVTHRIGEKIQVTEQTKSLKNLVRTTEGEDVFKRIYYSPNTIENQQLENFSQNLKTTKENQQLNNFAQNLKAAQECHRNDINFMEPIMNFNKPVNDNSSIWTDNVNTGVVTNRTSAITVRTTPIKSMTRDSPDIYKIQSRNRNSNSYGQINCPYRLYPRTTDSLFINKHKNSIIPLKVMQKMDPQLYQEIHKRIADDYPEYGDESVVIPSSIWNKYGLIIGKEKEGGSSDGNSQSHSITLMTRSNRTCTESNYSGSASARSVAPQSPSQRSIVSQAISVRNQPYCYSNGSS